MSSTSNHSIAQHSDRPSHPTQDALRDIAMQEGTQIVTADFAEEVVLKFTDREKTMLKKLTASLALSVRVIVESAISYVYFYTQDRGLRVEALPEYPEVLGSHDFRLALAAETTHKLEELGMTQHLNECVVAGIHLLYNQLIEDAKVKV
jgi:hypothetical protein